MIDEDTTRARELARMDDWSDAESADAQRVLCVLLGILDAQDARIGPSIHDDPVAIAKRWLGEGRREPDFDANPEDTASFLASHVLRMAPVVAAACVLRDVALDSNQFRRDCAALDSAVDAYRSKPMKSIEHHKQLAREAKAEGCRHGSTIREGRWPERYAHCCECGVRIGYTPDFPGWIGSPANDTADALVELTAASIAADRSPNFVAGLASEPCMMGRPDGQCAACNIAHLAACIVNHDAEQAETGGEG